MLEEGTKKSVKVAPYLKTNALRPIRKVGGPFMALIVPIKAIAQIVQFSLSTFPFFSII